MANTTQWYGAQAVHSFLIDSTAVAGVASPTFTRGFRVNDINMQIVVAAPGATVTLTRTRSGATSTLVTFDASVSGRAPQTTNIDQSVALFQSGDVLTLTTSDAAVTLNCFVTLVQFSN